MIRFDVGRVFALAVLVGVCAVSGGWAQSTEPPASPDPAPEQRNGGGGFFAIGVQSSSLGPLNTRLRESGYPTFPTELVSIGGGGYGVVGERLLLGGEGHALIGSPRTTQGRTVSVGGGYGLFTIGYQFRPTPRLRAHPLLGVGAGGVTLDIGSTGEDQFEDVLQNPNRSASLTRASLLVSIGGGAEYRFSTGETTNDGMLVGVRAGYVWAPTSSDWTLGDDSLAGGPDATLGGRSSA